jgi:hypothetical protein
MKRLVSIIFVLGVAIALSWGGHELPVYPSFYPHEIEIRTVLPDGAAQALRAGNIQAYVGPGLSMSGTPPVEIQEVESLGSFVTVQLNPGSPRATNEASACAVVSTVMRALTSRGDLVLHPYPVTPFHGDYLHHSDLATAAKTRFATGDTSIGDLKIKTDGRLKQHHPNWSANADAWDVEVAEVDAAALMAAATFALNGWLAPPWVRTGWFHAEQLLAGAVDDPERRRRVDSDLARLKTGDFAGLVDRINLERELVTTLTGGCWKVVVGYTVKREYVNVEFSAGLENIGYDAIAGLHSPIFVRTVKLKDFPWNGWLALGTAARPASAWNPIGGMADPFGRMMGFAVGDPALLPSPYEAGWMLNRIADVASTPGR